MKSQKRMAGLITDLKLYKAKRQGIGPMHGILTHTEALGITMDHDGANLFLVSPTGERVIFCTPHTALFKACIRDACRYAILKQLTDRMQEAAEIEEKAKAAGKKPTKKTRKDMIGVTPLVDHEATMAMLKCGKKDGKAVEGRELKEGDPEGEDPNYLCRPCRLQPKSYRRLQTIVAGSIRPPHRLKHITDEVSDVCDHPQCDGARCDTT